jgi:maltooligosyltrehalose trehalohydrolase
MQRQLHDPDDPQTFLKCKLDFTERQKHAGAYAMHRDLLKLRREDPRISSQDANKLEVGTLGHETFLVRFFSDDSDDRLLMVNFGRDTFAEPCPQPLLAAPEGRHWKILWSSDDPAYGGNGTPEPDTDKGWRIPGVTTVLLKPTAGVKSDDK